MQWNKDLTLLKRELANLYLSKEDSQEVARDAKLNMALIRFDNKASTNWSEIIDEAIREKKVLNIIHIAIRDFPNHKILLDIEKNLEEPMVANLYTDYKHTLFLNLPPRVERFVGREEQQKFILDNLRLGRVVTVCGPGGMGKTALVSEILWTLASSHKPPSEFPDGFFFYSFYGKPQVVIALEQLALALNWGSMPISGLTPDMVVQQALNGKSFLLVFDGVEEADDLERLLGVCGNSAVLMTTHKRSDAPDPNYRLVLGPLPAAEAVSVVQSIGGRRTTDSANHEATSEICTLVGNLPMALYLIGRYLSQQDENASEYLSWLRKEPMKALEYGSSSRRSVERLYKRSISRLSPEAERVLATIGCFGLAPLERELLAQVLGCTLEEIMQALGELVNYGLLVRPQNTYEVTHSLIHTYVREALLSRDKLINKYSLAEQMIEALDERFPELVEYTNWLQCEELLPHILACAAFMVRYRIVLPKAAHLLNRAGRYLLEQAQYTQAQLLLDQARSLYEQVLQEDYTETAVTLHNLAILYQNQGRYEEADIHYRRALDIREKRLDPDHPDTASSLNGMGKLYRNQGKYDDAERLLRRALDIREKRLGPNHPDTATSLNDLGRLYYRQGKYAEAEPLLQRALDIRQRVLGPNQPETALSFNNLARLYYRYGKYTEAEPLLKSALDIRQRVLGSDHPDTATSLNNLGVLYHRRGEYVEAEPLLQRALDIRENRLGPDHLEVAFSLNDIGALYHSLGKYAEAEPLLQRALDIRENRLGPDHPDTARSLNYLAYFYHSLGKYAEAEPLLQRALETKERVLGLHHPSTASSLNNLAVLYHSLGKYAEAEPPLQRAYTIRELVLGPDHPDNATSLNDLGGLYDSQGKYAEAEPLLQRALDIRERVLDPDHLDIATSLSDLGRLFYHQGNTVKAETLLQQALDIRQRVLGPDQPETAISLNNLGRLFYRQKKYTEAEPLLAACFGYQTTGAWFRAS